MWRTPSFRWTAMSPGTSPRWPSRRPPRSRSLSLLCRLLSCPASSVAPTPLSGISGRPDQAQISGPGWVSINRETIDLRYVEQLRDREQSAALGYAMVCAQQHLMDGRHTLSQIVAELEAMLDEKRSESPVRRPPGVPFLARPRTQELFRLLQPLSRLTAIRDDKFYPLRKCAAEQLLCGAFGFGESEEHLLVHGCCAGNEFSFTVIAQDGRIVV